MGIGMVFVGFGYNYIIQGDCNENDDIGKVGDFVYQ